MGAIPSDFFLALSPELSENYACMAPFAFGTACVLEVGPGTFGLRFHCGTNLAKLPTLETAEVVGVVHSRHDMGLSRNGDPQQIY